MLAAGCRNPDGVAIDAEAGNIYWTNMGVPNLDEGTIERADLDGQNARPWFPREPRSRRSSFISIRRTGSSTGRIVRACASCVEPRRFEVEPSCRPARVRSTAATRPDVRGHHVDRNGRHVYWTQKGPDNGERGRVCRAALTSQEGKGPLTAATSKCCSTVCRSRSIWSSISSIGILYWTDAGIPTREHRESRIDDSSSPSHLSRRSC